MKKSALIWIVVALAVAALVFDAFFAVRHGFFDLNVYYGAINYWANGGDIYDFVRNGSTYGFTYPPFAALTMLPMVLLSWPVAVAVGSLATIGVTIWLMRELLAPVAARHGWKLWFVLAISLCLLAVYEPFRETFLFGQVNMLLLGLVAADLLLLGQATHPPARLGGSAAEGELEDGGHRVRPAARLGGDAVAGVGGGVGEGELVGGGQGVHPAARLGGGTVEGESRGRVSRRSHWFGVGIGLATAIKLTPGIFIVYLLITRRWRAALVASGTAAVATLGAAAIAPDSSREFWTSALWDTDRVGVLAFISNQSVQGVLARLDPAHPSKVLWALGVLAVLALWFVRCRRAAATGDETLGLALTGIVGVLISPVTWVHHLVWAIPAFVLIVDRGGRRLQIFAALAFAVLCSRLVWVYQFNFSGVDGFLFSNAYVWIMLALLALTPGLAAAKDDAQLGGVKVAAGMPVGVPRSVRV